MLEAFRAAYVREHRACAGRNALHVAFSPHPKYCCTTAVFYLSFCVFWDSLRAFEPKRKAGTFQLYMRIHIYGVEYIPEMCGSTFWQRAPLFCFHR